MAIEISGNPPMLKHIDGRPVVVSSDEWNYTIVDLATDAAATIYAGPCVLGNIFVKAALSAHACPILDGVTGLFDLPASLAINSVVEWCRGLRCSTSLIVNSNDSATGTIIVMWRPI